MNQSINSYSSLIPHPFALLSSLSCACCAGDVLFNHARYGLAACRADYALLFLAAFEKDERGDAFDPVALRDGRVVVNVKFDDARASSELLCHGFDRRRNHAARRAPRSPEINQHGLIRLQHVFLETVVAHFGNMLTHAISPLKLNKSKVWSLVIFDFRFAIFDWKKRRAF